MTGEWINTYEACDEHKNGHAGHCEKCEQERLRELLRQVANGEVVEQFVDQDAKPFVTITIDGGLWSMILPLRNHTNTALPRTRYEMTDAATATGMYDHDDGG